MKILIVDDRQENRYMLETLLASKGYETVTASNGKEALEKLQSGSFDLIISDILMPVMDGFQLCCRCKEDDALKQIPFVFYTATYVDEKDEAFAYEIGADNFLRKPMEPDAFLEAIRDIVKNTSRGKIAPRGPAKKEAEETFKLYSERLVNKLEKKMQDLERELSERKKAEKKIRKLSVAVEQSPSIVMITDIEGNIEYVNPKFEEITGYTAREALGMNAMDLGAQSKEETEKMYSELNSGQEWRGEFQNRKKNGERYWEAASISPILDEENRITQFVKIAEDITDRKRMERELRESENKIRLLLDSTAEGIYGLDMNGNCTFANNACLTLLGYNSIDDLLGKNMHKLIHHTRPDGSPYPIEQCPIYMAFTSGEKMYVEDDILWRSDGTSFPAEYWSYPILQDDQVIGAVVTFMNISERKRVERALQQAQKMEAIGTLAGGIAHDFNNILSAIIGFTQLAMDQVPKESPIHADLKEVYKGGERARDLVKQILTFSRQIEEEVSPIQIAPIIKEALKLLRASLPATVEIRQEIEPKVGNVMADPTRIHQIIMNLCTNAGHAMKEKGGIMEVSLTRLSVDQYFAGCHPDLKPGEFVRLAVGDTGYGIAPEILPKIFEPYFTTKRRGEGTGLGLAVAQGILQAYGGTMTVYSEPGQGAIFHVYLPIIQEEAKPKVDKPESVTGEDERILLVDDETSIAKMGKRILEQLGYRVETRTSPLDALDLFKTDPDQFDLIITDMTMPHMTGDSLAQELMKIRPDIPVILCTGFSEKMTGEKTKELGIKALIMKPIIRDELAFAIRKAIEGD